MSKTHVIDGVTYVEVERKAEIGEKIVAIEADDYGIGEILTATESDRWGTGEGISIKEYDCGMYHEEYRVLKPLAVETPQVTDILANLARRVHSLEQQLRDTQGNVEKLAEELANTKHLAGSNEQDIAMLDERTNIMAHTQKFYNDKTSTTEFTVDMILRDLDGLCQRIRKAGGASK
jgi:hypothetical protein